jgi:hypothetical protein
MFLISYAGGQSRPESAHGLEIDPGVLEEPLEVRGPREPPPALGGQSLLHLIADLSIVEDLPRHHEQLPLGVFESRLPIPNARVHLIERAALRGQVD